MSFFPHAPLLRQVGQSGLLGGGASVPGPRLNTRVCPKVCGPSGVLTKPGISGELQDLLILWRKEALKGCRTPAH